MNGYFALGGVLAIVLGIFHSVIGERLIFSALSAKANRVALTNVELSPRRIAALRSTWHLLSIFGWGFGALMLLLSLPTPAVDQLAAMRYTLVVMFGISTVFWVVGTKGKHPAWIVLLIITCCIGLA